MIEAFVGTTLILGSPIALGAVHNHYRFKSYCIRSLGEELDRNRKGKLEILAVATYYTGAMLLEPSFAMDMTKSGLLVPPAAYAITTTVFGMVATIIAVDLWRPFFLRRKITEAEQADAS